MRAIPIATIGTVFAYRHIVDLLRHCRPKEVGSLEVYFSADFPPSMLSDNLILIGFPDTNLVTREVTNRVTLPVPISGHSWTDAASGSVFTATVREGHVVEDCGAVIRIPNPYNPRSIVYIFAGTQTFGMKAAAEFMNKKHLLELTGAWLPEGIARRTPDFLKPLIARNGRNRHYEIIVQAHVNRYFSSDPEKVRMYRI